MLRKLVLSLCLMALGTAWGQSWPAGIHGMPWEEKKAHLYALYGPDDSDRERIAEAAPSRPAAPVQTPRRLLVYYRCPGYVHQSIAVGNLAWEELGRRSGAFEATLSDDPNDLLADHLARFDALLINNNAGFEKSLTEDMRRSILDFVGQGKGFIGIHAAGDACRGWKEGGALIGATFSGHPWGCGNTCAVRVESPEHPLNASFQNRGFWINDEIYSFGDGPSRDRSRILLSLDMTAPQNRYVPRGKRTMLDGRDDFPVSWIRSYGEGRVFYCSLGHQRSTYWNPRVMEHYLAGIQYALGDLEADGTPSARLTETAIASCPPLHPGAVKDPSGDEMDRIGQAVAGVAAQVPGSSRKIVFLRGGDEHPVAPVAVHAFRELGRATGAYELETRESLAGEKALAGVDALLFWNTRRLDQQLAPESRRAVLEFVGRGKGVIGIGAVAEGLQGWPDGARLLGAAVRSRPFHADGTWPYQLESPDHLLNQGFSGNGVWLQGAAYLYREEYLSRDRSRVLARLDIDAVHRDKMMHPQHVHLAPTGGDYPVAWIHRQGKGRVFYTGLGSDELAFQDPAILQHYLNGIQYAVGDLEVDETPSAVLVDPSIAVCPPLNQP